MDIVMKEGDLLEDGQRTALNWVVWVGGNIKLRFEEQEVIRMRTFQGAEQSEPGNNLYLNLCLGVQENQYVTSKYRKSNIVKAPMKTVAQAAISLSSLSFLHMQDNDASLILGN